MDRPTSSELVGLLHLKNTNQDGYDLDVLRAWDDYTGRGVKLVDIDDGFDHTLADFANYDQSRDHDYGQNDADALPVSFDDNHGTETMGVAGAAADGQGVVGVAYGASLIGYRVNFNTTNSGFNLSLAKALRDAADTGGDTVNLSLGTGYYFTTVDSISSVTGAIDYAVQHGRDGLGTVMVMAGGNSRGDVLEGQINGRTFDANTEMIAVASVDSHGDVSFFSSYGAPLLVSAFGENITSTDRAGVMGDNSAGDTTDGLYGTSFAAPMVTGITALMLEANPDLGWRDVQTILAYSARHVGSPVDGAMISGFEKYAWAFNDATNWNGGGLHYSQDYGYGLVDATAAVRLAETWDKSSTSANQKLATGNLLTEATDIPNTTTDPDGTVFSTHVATALDTERVELSMTFDGNPGTMTVYLTGPDGQEQEFVSEAGNFSDSNTSTRTFAFQSQQYRGVDSAGDWSVRVVNAGDTLSVSAITLDFLGAAASKSDTYVYTNEFSDYAGNGHTRNLRDIDGGTDTLNASAVTAAMTVDLAARTAQIDGVAMKISGIENIDGGDGNDHLTGNGSANALAGGRGADVLAGGKGADSFVFRMVRDSRDGDKHDTITDFGKGDRIDLSDIDTLAKAGDQGFRFVGSNGFDGKASELDFHVTDKKGTAHDHTMIFADLDGDKHAEFQIELAGAHTLVKGDFIL